LRFGIFIFSLKSIENTKRHYTYSRSFF